jgi:hypothetical protein
VCKTFDWQSFVRSVYTPQKVASHICGWAGSLVIIISPFLLKHPALSEDVLIATLKRYVALVYVVVMSTNLVSTSPPTRKATEARFDLAELKQSCILINTADYCQTTALEVRHMTWANEWMNSSSVRRENPRKDQRWIQGSDQFSNRAWRIREVCIFSVTFLLYLTILQRHFCRDYYSTAWARISMRCCFCDYGSYILDYVKPSQRSISLCGWSGHCSRESDWSYQAPCGAEEVSS